MAHQVRIFTEQFRNDPGYAAEDNSQRAQQRVEAVQRLEEAVSKCIGDIAPAALASVEWLQSSAACNHGSFTQLTAIVRFIR